MPRLVQYGRTVALDRAVTLFGERGYYATSMRRFEQALDMRPATLYAAFGSKAGLCRGTGYSVGAIHSLELIAANY